MPLLDSAFESHPAWLGPHVQTLYPALFRRVEAPPWQRQEIGTPDGDSLHLVHWETSGKSQGRVLLTHGLEGSVDSAYLRGLAWALHRAGYSVSAWNFRGCWGGPNRLPRFYHSGDTQDLDTVLTALPSSEGPTVLIGFSLGANLVLKYMGELGQGCWPERGVSGALAWSAPCHLSDSADVLDGAGARLYLFHFLRKLKAKVRQKARLFPEDARLSPALLKTVHSIRAFDQVITAPLHGFASAADYYQRNAALGFLPSVDRPVFILNAADDPLLSESSHPVALARQHRWLHLELSAEGGHCGFRSKQGWYMEERSVGLIQSLLAGHFS